MPGTHIYKGKFLRTNPDGILENNLSYKSPHPNPLPKGEGTKEENDILIKALLMNNSVIPRDEEIIKQRILIQNPNYVSYEEVKNEEIEDFLAKYGVIPKKEEETSPLPMGEGLGVRANKEQNIGGTTFTEEEWNKRQDNIKKKEEIIEKVKREREENNGKLKNSEYNNEEEKKEGQEEKYNIYWQELNKIREEIRQEQEIAGEQDNTQKWENIFDIRKKRFHEENGMPAGNDIKIYYTGKHTDNKGKKWLDKPYIIAGIPTYENIYNEYNKFIEYDIKKIEDYKNFLEGIEKGGKSVSKYGIDLKVSSYLLNKFLDGKGKNLNFNEEIPFIIDKFKDDGYFNIWLNNTSNKLKKAKNEKHLNNILKEEIINGLDFGFNSDFKYAFGAITIKSNAKFDKNGNILLNLYITDQYDFHFTDIGGERFTGLSKLLNEAGLYLQENGGGKKFSWEMNLDYTIKK